MRYCPNCWAEVGETGPGFCSQWCEWQWQEFQEYGLPGEFEADVPAALAERQMILLIAT